MKKIVLSLLAYFARKIIKKYEPLIVGVTGSVGKTSAKQAIHAVASQKYFARTNSKNYNNEFGLPFTVIGVDSPKRNPFKWAALFFKAGLLLLIRQNYPEVLVLEMGVDRQGDMDKLISIAPPDIAVLTTIGVSHLEFFGSQDNILKEKSKIFSKMTKSNFAILNYDDERVKSLEEHLKARVISYGFAEKANVNISNYNVKFSEREKVYGTEAQFDINKQRVNIFLKNSIGLPVVSAAAAGAAVGLALGISVEKICNGLSMMQSEPGRMQILAGKNDSLILNDSYNAAPLSMKVAMEELMSLNPQNFQVSRRVAVLGDMLELGEISKREHVEAGKFARSLGLNVLIGVGERMRLAEPDFWFPSLSPEAQNKIAEYSQKGSIILIKGSNGMHLERLLPILTKND